MLLFPAPDPQAEGLTADPERDHWRQGAFGEEVSLDAGMRLGPVTESGRQNGFLSATRGWCKKTGKRGPP